MPLRSTRSASFQRVRVVSIAVVAVIQSDVVTTLTPDSSSVQNMSMSGQTLLKFTMSGFASSTSAKSPVAVTPIGPRRTISPASRAHLVGRIAIEAHQLEVGMLQHSPHHFSSNVTGSELGNAERCS
jgi:hypothetical protein